MLRISAPIENHERITLRLDGDISGIWNAILEEECRRLSLSRLQLDLTHVAYVDPTGRDLLRRLIANGVGVLNCSPMIEEMLREESAE